MAAPASASEVLRVTPGGVVPQNDPALPGAPAELQAPPATSCTTTPPVARPTTVSGSVLGVLRADYKKGALTAELYNDYKGIYAKAVSTYRRLSGTRRLNLQSLVGTLDR